MHVHIHQGDRRELLPLFRLADDSESEMLSYYRLGEALVATDDDKIVGVALVEKDGDTVQIISLAVVPARRGEGIGCRLIEEATTYRRHHRVSRLIVCTGAWENGNIAFYARRGFRLFHIERDYFTLEKGYAEVGDQVQFEMTP